MNHIVKSMKLSKYNILHNIYSNSFKIEFTALIKKLLNTCRTKETEEKKYESDARICIFSTYVPVC